MGSFSVAYYTIAPLSLDLLRPALLSETKKRGVVLRGGYDPPTKTINSPFCQLNYRNKLADYYFRVCQPS